MRMGSVSGREKASEVWPNRYTTFLSLFCAQVRQSNEIGQTFAWWWFHLAAEITPALKHRWRISVLTCCHLPFILCKARTGLTVASLKYLPGWVQLCFPVRCCGHCPPVTFCKGCWCSLMVWSPNNALNQSFFQNNLVKLCIFILYAPNMKRWDFSQGGCLVPCFLMWVDCTASAVPFWFGLKRWGSESAKGGEVK